MKHNKSALLVIDAQNDFHDIPGAALPVPGAVADTQRIADFIRKINPGTIFASQDTHYPLAIFHPSWFKDAKGDMVKPFTQILANDVREGRFVPRIDPTGTLRYLDALEADGEFKHMIWPEHCIIGTEGHNFHTIFLEAIKEWMVKNLRWANFITKGANPFTEHYGIFRANVPIASDAANTDVNQGIFEALNNHETIYLAGQAKSHCVANSLRQMMQISPQLAPKLVILEDCMSNVPGLPPDFYTYVDGIYSDAVKQGVRVAKSTDL